MKMLMSRVEVPRDKEFKKERKRYQKKKENMKKRTNGPDNDIGESKIKKVRKTSGVKLGRPKKTKDVDDLI